MNVNRKLFITVVVEVLNFYSSDELSSETKSSLKQTLTPIAKFCSTKGLEIKHVEVDRYFENIKDKLLRTHAITSLTRCQILGSPFRRIMRTTLRHVVKILTRNRNILS